MNSAKTENNGAKYETIIHLFYHNFTFEKNIDEL